MKKVIQEDLAKEIFGREILTRIDFLDTYSTTNHLNTLEEIVALIFNTMPKWIQVLLKLRNRLVRVVGLKSVETTSKKESSKDVFKIIELEKENIVLGVDDSHLNFRVVVQKTNADFYNIKVSTLVEYHHFLGRVYMWFVKPFHKLVVKQMVKQAFRIE